MRNRISALLPLERLGAPFLDAVRRRAVLTDTAEREPRDNRRFVVTSLQLASERVYALYCPHGAIENRVVSGDQSEALSPIVASLRLLLRLSSTLIV